MTKTLITFLMVLSLCLIPVNAIAQEPTVSELYEALLEAKDAMINQQQERLDFYSNVISWVLAGSAIISTLAVGFITYFYRSLLRDIKKRNAQLKQQEELIAKIAEASEFQDNLASLQEEITRMGSDIHRTKNALRKNFGRYY